VKHEDRSADAKEYEDDEGEHPEKTQGTNEPRREDDLESEENCPF